MRGLVSTSAEKIAVVTDSTADIPTEIVQSYGIYIVPAILIIHGQSLQDGADVSRTEFYQNLPTLRPLPTTAAPSPGAFQELYAHIFAQGVTHILSIHISSALSGIYNAAHLAAQSFGSRISVIDSGQTTLGLGFQALWAVEALRQGMTLSQVRAGLDSMRCRVVVLAMLDTLEYLRRSGRISWARASLGTFLHIKPFIELREGVVRRMGEARTRQKGIERLQKLVEDIGPVERLAVLHTNAVDDAHNFQRAVRTLAPELPLIANVTTVIGAHVGPNALGIVVVKREA